MLVLAKKTEELKRATGAKNDEELISYFKEANTERLKRQSSEHQVLKDRTVQVDPKNPKVLALREKLIESDKNVQAYVQEHGQFGGTKEQQATAHPLSERKVTPGKPEKK